MLVYSLGFELARIPPHVRIKLARAKVYACFPRRYSLFLKFRWTGINAKKSVLKNDAMVTRMKQMNLFKEQVTREFGGSLLVGKRKCSRPLDTKRSIHLVLKATNAFVLLRSRKLVESRIDRISRRFGVKVYRIGIHADHVHVAIKIPNRNLYCRWIRVLTSCLVREISGLKFSLRPYSRVVNWGREFKSVCAYVYENFLEGDFLLKSHLHVDDWRKEYLDRILTQINESRI